MNKSSLVSVIIPSLNESKDIRDVIEHVLSNSYKNIEIICVDDSTDDTPKIISEFQDQGVILLRPDKRRGLNYAYNLGMKSASGEILVLLTSDNMMPKDFIDNILKHFLNGKEVVVPLSMVKNKNSLFARYHQSMQSYKYLFIEPVWSEGFSLRSDVAKEHGYFLYDSNMSINGGSDITFATELLEKYNAIYDPEIIMEHVWPDNHQELINQQVDRGIGFTDTTFYYRELDFKNIIKSARIINSIYKPGNKKQNSYKLLIVFLRTIIKTLKRIIMNGVFLCFYICKYSPNGYKDYLGFLYTHNLTSISISIGEFKGVYNILLRDILTSDKKSSN